MNISLLQNLIDPAILFFFFGIFAATVKSNLEIPSSISKFFSLYLLMSVGFKGGVSIATSGFSQEMATSLLLAMFLALIVPIYSYVLLHRIVGAFDAAAIAATYGSVSAVTFITATGFLERQGISFGGHMSVALVLMESPAIIMAVLLANWVRSQQSLSQITSGTSANYGKPLSIKHIIHEAFTDGAHLLLLGGLIIGWATGLEGKKVMDPFTGQLFKGILAFFLLEMGLNVGRQLKEVRKAGPYLVLFGLAMPPFNAALAAVLGWFFGLTAGDTILLAVLASSASYIVVPAVLRYAIPEAKPSLYFSMALVVTFPFNIIFGIPMYTQLIQKFWVD